MWQFFFKKKLDKQNIFLSKLISVYINNFGDCEDFIFIGFIKKKFEHTINY